MTTFEFSALVIGDVLRDQRGIQYRIVSDVRDGNRKLISIQIRHWFQARITVTRSDCAIFTRVK